MTLGFGCPVCGDDDCARHRAVLAAAGVLNVCAIAGLGLLVGGLVLAGIALVE
jgi:hypothetical protein